jgi:flagellar motor protein MotB
MSTTTAPGRGGTPLPTAPPITGDIPTVGLLEGKLPRVGAPTTATSVTTTPPPQACQEFTLQDLVFASGSPELSPEAAPALAELARRLGDTGQITIVGFSDARPFPSYPGDNLGLSADRARRVAHDLVHVHGIDERRIVEVYGLGADHPVAAGDNEAAWAKNRRVEVSNDCGPTR